MSIFPSSISLKLPVWVQLLIAGCALYTGAWGLVMLFDPELYFFHAELTPDVFPPSVAFWGWFGISGLLFYGLYLLPKVHRQAPFYAFFCAMASLAGVFITVYQLGWGDLSSKVAVIHLTGDLMGMVGFGAAAWMDYAVRRNHRLGGLYFEGGKLGTVTDHYTTSQGISLTELIESKETLMVFLRHFGCTFCREALEDVARRQLEIEKEGKAIVLVHMVDDDSARKHIAKYGLEDVHRVSDPKKRLYQTFDLQRGRLKQLFGGTVWLEGFRAGILRGHLVGRETGDGFQMPGVFLVHKGQIKQGFRHELASDRPDYCRVGECS